MFSAICFISSPAPNFCFSFVAPFPILWYHQDREGVIFMFTLDVPMSELEAILSEVKAAGGDAVRFTVYENSDEVPNSFTTCGLRRPSTELDSGGASFFPSDFRHP